MQSEMSVYVHVRSRRSERTTTGIMILKPLTITEFLINTIIAQYYIFLLFLFVAHFGNTVQISKFGSTSGGHSARLCSARRRTVYEWLSREIGCFGFRFMFAGSGQMRGHHSAENTIIRYSRLSCKSPRAAWRIHHEISMLTSTS